MYTDSEFSRYQCDHDSNLHPQPTLTIKTPIYLPTEGRCNGPCATRHSCWWVVGTNTLYIHTCLMFTRTLCILVRCSMCRHAGEVCVCVCVCVCVGGFCNVHSTCSTPLHSCLAHWPRSHLVTASSSRHLTLPAEDQTNPL